MRRFNANAYTLFCAGKFVVSRFRISVVENNCLHNCNFVQISRTGGLSTFVTSVKFPGGPLRGNQLVSKRTTLSLKSLDDI